MEGKKKLIVACAVIAVLLIGGIALTVQRCTAGHAADEQETAQASAQESAQTSQANPSNATDEEAQREYEKRQAQIEKSHQEALTEQQKATEREERAVAANTRYSLDEADKLVEVGVDEKCAQGALAAFMKFCDKKKLEADPLFDQLEVSKNDDGTISIPLSAEKYLKGGSKTVRITGTYAGGKLSFAVEK